MYKIFTNKLTCINIWPHKKKNQKTRNLPNKMYMKEKKNIHEIIQAHSSFFAFHQTQKEKINIGPKLIAPGRESSYNMLLNIDLFFFVQITEIDHSITTEKKKCRKRGPVPTFEHCNDPTKIFC